MSSHLICSVKNGLVALYLSSKYQIIQSKPTTGTRLVQLKFLDTKIDSNIECSEQHSRRHKQFINKLKYYLSELPSYSDIFASYLRFSYFPFDLFFIHLSILPSFFPCK